MLTDVVSDVVFSPPNYTAIIRRGWGNAVIAEHNIDGNAEYEHNIVIIL